MGAGEKGCGKGTFLFTRDQAAVLITIYQKYPSLYNIQSEGYKNKNRKLLCLKEMMKEFNDHFPLACVNIEDIKKKINSLRTQFFAELNKVKKSFVSGAGADNIYTPSLWCYDQLLFLNESNIVRTGESNLEQRDEINAVVECNNTDDPHIIFEGSLQDLEEMESSIVMSPDSRPSTSHSNISEVTEPTKKKRKNIQKDAKAVEILEKANTLLESAAHPLQEMNNLDSFGAMIVSELREIKDPVRCRQVKRKILDIIHDVLDEEANY